MAIDIDEIIHGGGRELIDLLDYAVRAVQSDLLFVFLVREYRLEPTTPKAVALYDNFCGPAAVARLSRTEKLPPRDIHIEVAVRPLQLNLARVAVARAAATAAPPLILPAKFLFDSILLHLRQNSARLREVRRRYQPGRTPLANLSGGRMNAGQRYFVERIWEPKLRPQLVTAGFRRVASVA